MIRHRLAASFLAQLFALAATVATRLLLTGLLIRAWGPEQFADWVVIVSMVMFIGLPDSCLQVFFGNMFHRCYATKDLEGLTRWVGIALLYYLVIYSAILLVAIGAFLLMDVASVFNLTSNAPAVITAIVGLLVIDRCLYSFRGPLNQLYRATGEVARQINSGTLLSVTVAVVVGASVLAGAMPDTAAVLMVGVTISVGLIGMVINLKRRLPWLSLRPVTPTKEERSQILATVRLFAVDQTGPMLLNELPTVLLAGAATDPRLIVLFVTTRMVVNLVRHVQASAAISLGIQLADYAYARNQGAGRQTLVGGIGIVALGTAVLASLIAAHAGNLLAAWTGRNDLFDPFVFMALLLAVVMSAPTMVLAMGLTYTNQPAPTALARIIHLTLFVLGAAIAYQTDFFYGVVIALATAEIIAQTIVLPMAARGTEFRLSLADYAKVYGRALGAFTLIYVAGASVEELYPLAAWPVLLAKATVTGLIALAVGFTLLSKWERRQIWSVLKALGERWKS
jgi:hypothetical protein